MPGGHWSTLAAEPAHSRLVITEHTPYPASPKSPSNKIVIELVGDTPAKREFIAKQWKLAEGISANHRRHFGPDASYVSIVIEVAGHSVTLESWHPLFEENPRLVVTSHGVGSLEGKTREEVLKKEPAWYLEFRRVFDSIVEDAKAFGK